MKKRLRLKQWLIGLPLGLISLFLVFGLPFLTNGKINAVTMLFLVGIVLAIIAVISRNIQLKNWRKKIVELNSSEQNPSRI